MALRLNIDQGIPIGLMGPAARGGGRFNRGHQMPPRARRLSGRIIGLACSQMPDRRQHTMTLEEVDGVSQSTAITAHPHRVTGTAGEVMKIRLGGLVFSTMHRNHRGGRKALPEPWRSKEGGNMIMRGRRTWFMRDRRTWSLVGISTS